MDKIKPQGTDPLLAYLSGLFDIGGCIKIETPKKSAEASLFIWVTYKNFRLMELLQKRGAHIGQKSDGAYRAKWRDRAAFVMLKKLMPYLIIRKDQAKIGVEFFDEKQENNTPQTDTIFKLRLRLQKRRDSDEGGT
jgi:hypothetical protein